MKESETDVRSFSIATVTPAGVQFREDQLAIEAPLEITIGYGPPGQRRKYTLAVTMRTPGADVALALGFLLTEGIIGGMHQVASWRSPGADQILLELQPGVPVDLAHLQRNMFAASSCGICGKAGLDAIETTPCFFPQKGSPRVPFEVLSRLPARLRAAQPAFGKTGGLHAAALFDSGGTLQYLCEDIGRHNAVDKVIGAAMLDGRSLPLRDLLLLVSGRAGFELVQKATMAGLPLLAAVGAPSSMAVDMADLHGLTLVGFLREDRCNVYTHFDRIDNITP